MDDICKQKRQDIMEYWCYGIWWKLFWADVDLKHPRQMFQA